MNKTLNSFLSIDFETANPKRVSACSLGIVKVVDGVVIYSRHYLIKPVGEYSSINSLIHGITEADTNDAPTFDVIFEEIRDDFENLTVLSYSSFDRSVFEELVRYYNIQLKDNVAFLDVCAIARDALNLPNYKLPTVAYHLGIDRAKHHNAQCDAEQCAKIFLKLSPVVGSLEINHEDNALDSDASFTALIDDITADGVIETEEAYLLLSFLECGIEYNKVWKLLYDLVSEVLDDGVVSREESEMLMAVIKYVMGKYNMPCASKSTSRCHVSVGRMDPVVEVVSIEVPAGFVPLKIDGIPENYAERWEYVKQHPFRTITSANVVITGNGCRIPRAYAEELTVKLGGKLKSSVARNTDICVCLEGLETGTGKAVKARELVGMGSPIRIVGEDEFIDLLKTTVEGVQRMPQMDQGNVTVMDDLDLFDETSKCVTGTCEGLTFAITGDLHYFTNRMAFRQFVESNGGTVKGTVSKQTNYLVNNDATSTSSKNLKAQELGIPVITEDELLEKFGSAK